jgi:hypothetical protein
MRGFYTAIATAAVLALPVSLPALTSTPQAEKAATKSEARAEKSAASEPSVMGTVEKFDAASKALTIKTKKGESTFSLGSDCTVAEGANTLAADDLSGFVGHPVKIYYSGGLARRCPPWILIEKAKPEKASKMTAKQRRPATK